MDNSQTLTKQDEMNPAQLLTFAVDKDLDIAKLEKLMDLRDRWQATEARKSFYEALMKFQKECPSLPKTKLVKFNNTAYCYTPLSKITTSIKAKLSECGLSYRWQNDDDGQTIKVTCIVTHKDGHSEQTTMSAGADKSGAKNEIQARGSAITYLQRYTLIGALGISTADQDTDANIISKSVDELHKEFMDLLNPKIQQDSKTWSKYLPDNWKRERTTENYIAAIKDIKQKLGLS